MFLQPVKLKKAGPHMMTDSESAGVELIMRIIAQLSFSGILLSLNLIPNYEKNANIYPKRLLP